jgi:hypothetical protein
VILVRNEVPYEPIKAKLTPGKGMDIGAGRMNPSKTTIYGGGCRNYFRRSRSTYGISTDPKQRISDLSKWSEAVMNIRS